MAKKSAVERELKRERLAKQHAAKRAARASRHRVRGSGDSARQWSIDVGAEDGGAQALDDL